MSKIQVGKDYTRAELQRVIDGATAKELELQGYVLGYDPVRNVYRVVPWKQTAMAGRTGERPVVQGTSANWGELPPIVKRTPQQRLDSLMLKWIADMKKAGGLPTLQSGVAPTASTADNDEAQKRRKHEIEENERRIQEIVGEAWKAGKPEITAEVVRQVAAHFLQQAERQAD